MLGIRNIKVPAALGSLPRTVWLRAVYLFENGLCQEGR